LSKGVGERRAISICASASVLLSMDYFPEMNLYGNDDKGIQVTWGMYFKAYYVRRLYGV
jgi:hypothetical protein